MKITRIIFIGLLYVGCSFSAETDRIEWIDGIEIGLGDSIDNIPDASEYDPYYCDFSASNIQTFDLREGPEVSDHKDNKEIDLVTVNGVVRSILYENHFHGRQKNLDEFKPHFEKEKERILSYCGEIISVREHDYSEASHTEEYCFDHFVLHLSYNRYGKGDSQHMALFVIFYDKKMASYFCLPDYYEIDC